MTDQSERVARLTGLRHKEPGQFCYEAHEAQYANQPDRPWSIVDDAERVVWQHVERAVRNAALEEAAGVAMNYFGNPDNEHYTEAVDYDIAEGRYRACAPIASGIRALKGAGE